MNDKQIDKFSAKLEELVEGTFGKNTDKVIEFMYVGVFEDEGEVRLAVGALKDQNSFVRKEILNEAAGKF